MNSPMTNHVLSDSSMAIMNGALRVIAIAGSQPFQCMPRRAASLAQTYPPTKVPMAPSLNWSFL